MSVTVATLASCSVGFIILACCAVSCAQPEPHVSAPVILIPGFGGSQLREKLNKPHVRNNWCEKQTKDYVPLWLVLTSFIPKAVQCFTDNFQLFYNIVTHTTSNNLGVDIIAPGFGDTSGIEFLDSPSATRFLTTFPYFNHIVESLVNVGYKRGESVRGAPYDFRKSPRELGEYYDNLKQLIEETHDLNEDIPVMLVTHSMGGLVTQYFLNHQTKAWKTKYIHSLVTLGAPWGGAVKSMRAIASGENFDVKQIDALSLRESLQSFPSTAFMMPSKQYWDKDEILVETSERNYTVADYEKFFYDQGLFTSYQMRQDEEEIFYNLKAPEVTVHCLHGIGVETIDSLRYPVGGFPDVYPGIVYGDGDGTVNLRSLKGCLRWKNKQYHTVHHKMFHNLEHITTLRSEDVSRYILEVLGESP